MLFYVFGFSLSVNCNNVGVFTFCGLHLCFSVFEICPLIFMDMVVVVVLELMSRVVDFPCRFRSSMVLFHPMRWYGPGTSSSPQPLALPCHNLFLVGDLVKIFWLNSNLFCIDDDVLISLTSTSCCAFANFLRTFVRRFIS